jgi:hypothetical protein
VAIENEVSQRDVARAIAAGMPQTWDYVDKCGGEMLGAVFVRKVVGNGA